MNQGGSGPGNTEGPGVGGIMRARSGKERNEEEGRDRSEEERG